MNDMIAAVMSRLMCCVESRVHVHAKCERSVLTNESMPPNHDCLKGLQSHTAARTAKLAILPTANPPTRQKLATVAATSTSSLLPFSRGLCSSDGADIMQRLDTYPFENPKTRRISMYTKSELISGADAGTKGERWMLHIRNKGMNSVRARDMVRRRLADQIAKRGFATMVRPQKSLMLKTRKW